MLSHIDTRSYRCGVCGLIFLSQFAQSEHLKLHEKHVRQDEQDNSEDMRLIRTKDEFCDYTEDLSMDEL